MSKYYFFATNAHPLSNFYAIGGDKSNTSERSFMYHKACYFEDYETARLIEDSKNPQEAKKLGRQVKNYDDARWSSVRSGAMYMALEWKLNNCPEFKEILVNNKDKTFVEAAPWDRIWGIGFSDKDAMANIDNWGQNLLGECITGLVQNKLCQ